MPALALTDHGCMFGAWTFQKAARREGLKPIIGMEAYVAPGDRRDRSRSGQGERAYYHLVLLARDLAGYRNLVKLSSIGYTEGFYHRPRVDREVLARHHEGIIVSSACMAGEVARHLMADDWDGGPGGRGVVRQPLRRPVLPRGPGPRLRGPGRAEPEGLRAGRRARAPGGRHQRRPLPRAGGPRGARRPAVHRTRQGPQRPEPDAATTGASTSRAPTEIAERFPGPPRRPGEHAHDRRRGRPGLREEVPPAGVPAPREPRRRERLPGAPGRRQGAMERYGDPLPDEVAGAASTTSWASSREPGYAGLLPDRPGLHPLGPGPGHPGRPGSRLGGRLAGGVRARDHESGPARVSTCCSSGS